MIACYNKWKQEFFEWQMNIFWMIAEFLAITALWFIFVFFIVVVLMFSRYHTAICMMRGERPEWYYPRLAAWMVRHDEKRLQEYCSNLALKQDLKYMLCGIVEK